jgi:single-strand DNA-binding protein
MSVNKVILVCRVGETPTIKEFDNGNKVANFSAATSEKYTKKDGEKVENVEWHRVAVFGKLAEIVEKYVKKGQQLYIEGKIKTRSYDDKDGNKRYTTEIVLEQYGGVLQMIGKRDESERSEPEQSKAEQPDDNEPLPF